MRLTNTPHETTVLRLEQRKSFSCAVLITDGSGGRVDLRGSTLTLDRVVNVAKLDRLDELTAADVASTTAELVDAEHGRARFLVQAAELGQPAGAYPFTITLRAPNHYSVVIVKGSLELQHNPEFASAGVTAADAQPGQNLEVRLDGQHVLRVEVGSTLPPGVRYLADRDQEKLDLLQVTDGDLVVDLTGYATVAELDALAFQLRAEMPLVSATIAAEKIAELRPAPRYGTVVSTDRTASTAVLLLSGESSHTTVKIGGVWPHTAGQVVRVETFDDGDYITDVLGPTGLPTPITLGEAVDLDDLVESGLYRQAVNAAAASGSNYPSPYAGMLEVQNIYRGTSPSIYQRYTTYGGSSVDSSTIYTRSYASGTWYPWQKNLSGPGGVLKELTVDGATTLRSGGLAFEADANRGIYLNSPSGTGYTRMLMTTDGRLIFNTDPGLATSNRVVMNNVGEVLLQGGYQAIGDYTGTTGRHRRMVAGTAVMATSAAGIATLAFAAAFPTGLSSLVVCPGDTAGGLVSTQINGFNGGNLASHPVRCLNSSGAVIVSTSVRLNYIATGY